MSKSLKFDRVANLDYLSAYEVIENLINRFGVADVQNALNEIAAQQGVQADGAYCGCKDYIAKPGAYLSICVICEKPRR